MRMWMTDPRIQCKDHLLGEHLEMHMFVGTLRRFTDVSGYLRNNLLEPLSLRARHDELVVEMERRGYNHKSPLKDFPLEHLTEERIQTQIDRLASFEELINRCPKCAERYNALMMNELDFYEKAT